MSAPRKDVLHRYVPKHGNRPFGVLDLETEGLGGNLIYGAAAYQTKSGRMKVIFFDDIEELLTLLTSHAGRERDWYAHNALGYDYKYFLPHKEFVWSRGYDIHIIRSGSQDIGLKFVHREQHRTIQLKDFFRLVPTKLGKLTKLFKVVHQKLDDAIDFEKERFNPNNPQHLEYLRHDVLGLYEVIDSFQQLWYSKFGTPLGWTTPASAFKAWRATIPEGHVYWRLNDQTRQFIRRAYYGGMPRVRHLQWESDGKAIIKGWDVNSMYPAMMKRGVPTGKPVYSREYVPNLPGFWRIRADVPEDTHYTILPFRDKEGTKFPRGRFETTCTNLEIEFAKKLGHKVEVLEGWYFRRIEPIFNDFVRVCEEIRQNDVYHKTPVEMVAKLAQNSLYGKFGSREEGTRLAVAPDNPARDPETESWRPYQDPVTGNLVEGVWEEDVRVDEPYLHPEWAAWITAQARIHLSEVAEPAARADRLVYTDTDSVKIICDEIYHPTIDEDEKRYGAWKFEIDADWWRCAGPKTYALHRIHHKPDESPFLVHTKGVPIDLVTPDMVDRASRGESVSVVFGSLDSFSRLVKTGQSIHLRSVSRTLTVPTKVLGWVVEEGKFRPVLIDEDALRAAKVQAEEEATRHIWERQIREERRAFFRLILRDHGGIKPSRDYPDVPVVLRRKNGLALDVMAQVLGYSDADELYQLILRYTG